MSVIHYKFKNASRKWDTVTFDGAVVSVFDLKKAIIGQKKLSKQTDDFDLLITNAQTGEDYRDEGFLIPKNTSVVVRRVPATRSRSLKVPLPSSPSVPTSVQGQVSSPTAAQQGTSVISTGGSSTGNLQGTLAGPPLGASVPTTYDGGMGYSQANIQSNDTAMAAEENTDEESKLSAVLNQASEYKLPGKKPMIPTRKISAAYARTPGAKPPPGYVCHRCHQPGHFIRNCPTNGDPAYDFRPAKNPVGTPRSFLKPIEDPKVGPRDDKFDISDLHPFGHSGHSGHHSQVAPLRVVASSSLVTLTPGLATNTNTTSSAYSMSMSSSSSSVFGSKNLLNEIQCPLCGGEYRDAVVTPCCYSSFCNECIRQVLVSDGNFTCPRCNQANISPEELRPNKAIQKKN